MINKITEKVCGNFGTFSKEIGNFDLSSSNRKPGTKLNAFILRKKT